MSRRLWAALAAALVLPVGAAAHVTVAPPFVEAGVATELAFATPNERAPAATIELAMTAPPGVEIVSATAPARWQVAVAGATVTWRGGRIEGTSTTRFQVRVLARVRAGTYTFTSRQRYSDGSVVRWQAGLSVLPAEGAAAPKQHPWEAVLAGAIGLAVIAGSLVLVRFLRRRSLQER